MYWSWIFFSTISSSLRTFYHGFCQGQRMIMLDFFSLAYRDRPKPHFPHLVKAEYSTRAIISHGLYIFNPLFEGQFDLYKGSFFLKILSLCTVSNQEQFIMAAKGIWLWKNPASHQRLKQKRIQDTHEFALLVRLSGSGWRSCAAPVNAQKCGANAIN